jgi:hypothetical protein
MTLSNLYLNAVIAAFVVPAITLANQTPTPQQAPPAAIEKQPDTSAKPHQPRPNPDASGKYHVGDGVTPPILIHSVDPEIPKKWRSANAEQCTVALTVGTDGKPIDVHIAPYSSKAKDEDNGDLPIETRTICINTVEQYRFKPATFHGKPVAVDLKVDINFRNALPR